MKIVYLGCFRLPNFDAAAPRVLNNARAMKLCGHELSFISWGGKYNEEHLCNDGKYRIEGMEYIITNELDPQGGPFKKFSHLLHRGDKSVNILDKMSDKPDLIIMYNASFGWTKRMLKYCKLHNIKLANDITEWYDNNEIHLWDILPYLYNMTNLQKKVKNKICISSYLDKFYVGSNNILLPPLCDPQEAKWRANVEDERIKPFDGVTLIYAGNPEKKDCVHTVINVVNKMAHEGKSIRFLILGITRDNYLERYANELMTKDLHENIIFLGRVSQDLIPAYYKKADFMVLLREPTRKSMAGFPTKFAESMTAGVPVIANATSDLGRYIINEKTGFLVKDEKACNLENILTDILTLSQQQIGYMKQCVMTRNKAFDYANYKDEMNMFLEKLK